MPTEHRLFLRGLREGEAIRLYCDDSEEASLVVNVVGCFIRRERKKGSLNHHCSVLKREERGSLVIYIIKG